ncbi:MAG: ACT domain-containing protein [Planctomycetota bacterium]
MHVGTQFSIYLINKPGVLAAVTASLAEAKANIAALALMDSGEHGALRIVCDEAVATREVLEKTSERWTETEVLLLELDNRPGSFAAVAKRLADANINITYAYFSGGRDNDTTVAVFKVPDPRKAQQVLKAAPEAR